MTCVSMHLFGIGSYLAKYPVLSLRPSSIAS